MVRFSDISLSTLILCQQCPKLLLYVFIFSLELVVEIFNFSWDLEYSLFVKWLVVSRYIKFTSVFLIEH